MDMTTTLVIMGIAAIVTGFANYKSRQPYEPGKLPWLPYNGLQFVGLIIVFLMAAHLITLITGKPFTGRRGW